MNRFSFFLFVSLLILAGCQSTPADIPPAKVTPTANMVEYQQMEMVGFIHFTVNTFTDREWGYGDEDPAIFNPTELDAEQWVKTAKDAGMKELILTAKHHDGFTLWPSKYTDHSIKNSPYKDGKGDIVREFVDAAQKYELKVGLYLSPWDRNHADYGNAKYIEYYRNQLTELLTEYGEINEIWFDGANGGDGYYGGANEVRKIDRETYYDWDSTFALVKKLQPNIKIFSDAGPDIHWIGNEHGFAGDPFWSTISSDSLVIGASDEKYLNTGDPAGTDWIVGQCDVSIRPGWFYHDTEDDRVKSTDDLLDIYYKSVGRNCVLLLNLPPDRRGLIHENDVDTLKKFRSILDATFAKNLISTASVSADKFRDNHPAFSPENVSDGNTETYWATDDGITSATITLTFPEEIRFSHIVLQEPIQFGQRIESFEIQSLTTRDWGTIFEGHTIGYKRIVKLREQSTSKISITFQSKELLVGLSEIKIF